jgi:hypothetical protein
VLGRFAKLSFRKIIFTDFRKKNIGDIELALTPLKLQTFPDKHALFIFSCDYITKLSENNK